MQNNIHRHKTRRREKTRVMSILLTALLSISAIVGGVLLLEKNSDNDQKESNRKLSENIINIEKESEKDTENVNQNQIENETNELESQQETSRIIHSVEEIPSALIEDETQRQEAAQSIINYTFASSGKIVWPVEGQVIKDFSVDKMVYFDTLNVYRCNYGVLIQSEAGTNVKSGASGVVKEIDYSADYGNSITVDIGNGYEITYAQIKNPQVKQGDTVDENKVIATVADPTSFFKNEGSHLYIELKYNGVFVDPMDYINY